MAFTRVRGPGITTDDNYRVGILTATKFVGPMQASGDSDFTNISATGIGTINGVKIGDPSGIVTASSSSGIVTYYGDASKLTGLTAGQIPNLAASKITSSTVATARLGSGTANNSTYLRGDQTWATLSTGPGTGEQYVTIDQNGNNSNSGTNVYAGYRSGQGLASGGTNENTFYGTDSGKATTTAGYNTYIGHRAGENSTVGSNVAVGAEALRNNTSSNGCNTAVGVLALTTNSSGRYNTAVGHYALKNASSGSRNTTVGLEAGLKITTASHNAAFGYQTLTGDGGSHNVTGESNVVMGSQSGYGISSGERNVLIGHQAGYDMNTGKWNSGLGFQALENVGAGSSNTACGYEAGYTLQTGNNNICLGFRATTTAADTSNEITLGNTDISNFRIPGLDFTVDNSGNLAVNGDITTGSTTDAELKINAASSMSSYVERNDGVWGSWSPVVQFKSVANSPGGTTFGRWGNHSEGHQVVFTKSRSNGSGGTSVAAGDDLGSIFWSPYNSANPGCSVQISVKADTGTWSSTSNPGYLAIKTTPSGQKNPSERMRFTSSGRIDILGDGGNAGFTLSNAYGQAGFFGGMYYNGSSWTRNAIGTRKGAGMYVNTGGHIAFLKAPETSGTSATVTESLRITSDGSIGVNEPTPDFSGFGGNGGGIELDDVNTGFTAVKLSQSGTDFYLVSHSSAAFISTRTNKEIVIEKNSTEVAKFTDNGLKVPSGKGIDFSSTSDASGMSNELLDDYEEGQWTPTVNVGTVGVADQGKYTKVGNIVNLQVLLYNFSNTSSSSSIIVTGVPYSCSGQAVGNVWLRRTNTNHKNYSCVIGDNATNSIVIVADSDGNNMGNNLQYNNFANSTPYMNITITYRTS